MMLELAIGNCTWRSGRSGRNQSLDGVAKAAAAAAASYFMALVCLICFGFPDYSAHNTADIFTRLFICMLMRVLFHLFLV